MPIMNILQETALTKSIDENSANAINMYLVESSDTGKYPVVAYPTPGLTIFTTLVHTPIRAAFEEHGVVYFVGGSKLYSVASNGTATELGTLNTNTGFAKIRGINDQLFIVDSSNGYYYIISLASFNTIKTSSAGEFIESIVINNGGLGYVQGDTVSFSGGGGSGAAATITVSGGIITTITLTNPGTGYTSTPTITINTSAGINATFTIQMVQNGFPTSIQDIECQDEFGLVLQAGTQIWWQSNVSDLSVWSLLTFDSVTGNENDLIGIHTLHRELWLFSGQTTEVWYNAGQANFTFARRGDVYIQWGCAARGSIAYGDNTLFWLGQSTTGGAQIIMADSYVPKVISTRAINYQISTLSTISDAIGFVYQQEGHEFYVLTFPTAGVTFTYDTSTGKFHERSTLINGVQSYWLPNCFAACYNLGLVGDPLSGNIYKLDMTNYTDNGAAITRTLITPPMYNVGVWQFIDKLQIDCDNAPGATLAQASIYISRDGGRTFGTAKPFAPQQDANGLWRSYWLRLGAAKAFVIKIQTSMNARFMVLGAWAQVRAGEPNA